MSEEMKNSAKLEQEKMEQEELDLEELDLEELDQVSGGVSLDHENSVRSCPRCGSKNYYSFYSVMGTKKFLVFRCPDCRCGVKYLIKAYDCRFAPEPIE